MPTLFAKDSVHLDSVDDRSIPGNKYELVGTSTSGDAVRVYVSSYVVVLTAYRDSSLS